MRVRVSLDVLFPLKCSMRIRMEGGDWHCVKPGKNSIFLKNGKTVISVKKPKIF